jgi:hypothetical protein
MSNNSEIIFVIDAFRVMITRKGFFIVIVNPYYSMDYLLGGKTDAKTGT